MRCAPAMHQTIAHNQGYLLANYLAGTNAAGQPVNWPVFHGSSTQGFAGKYTPRQLDSIVAQILSIGSKAISSDYPYHFRRRGGADRASFYGRALCVSWLAKRSMGDRCGTLHEGYPDVCGNRSVSFSGNLGPGKSFKYTPPQATFDFWLEWWLPASYFGGRQGP